MGNNTVYQKQLGRREKSPPGIPLTLSFNNVKQETKIWDGQRQ